MYQPPVIQVATIRPASRISILVQGVVGVQVEPFLAVAHVSFVSELTFLVSAFQVHDPGVDDWKIGR